MTSGGNSPFVLLVDGMIGNELQVILANLSRIVAAKMDEPILHVKFWVNCQISIAVARLYSRVLRRYQVPSPVRTRYPDWELSLGLGLVQ